MPTYEYKCEACGHTFEKFQSMTAAHIRKCPVCGKSRVKRLIGTGAGLIFKGSGFYITDYRSEAYKKSAKGDQPPAAPAGDSAKSGESKPAEAKPAAAQAKPAAASGESKSAEPKPNTTKSKSKEH
jgi:putative FmdB family regulatory protein